MKSYVEPSPEDLSETPATVLERLTELEVENTVLLTCGSQMLGALSRARQARTLKMCFDCFDCFDCKEIDKAIKQAKEAGICEPAA